MCIRDSLQGAPVGVDRPAQIIKHPQPVRPQREIDLTLPPRSTGGIREDHREHLDPGGGAERGVEVTAYGIGVVGEQEQDVSPSGVGAVSYTHLDVYKRQPRGRPRLAGRGCDRFPGSGCGRLPRWPNGPGAVSYTHLDVYKRQDDERVAERARWRGSTA